jgi:septum formation protein
MRHTYILASNSPRRRQLFALLGLPFDVMTVEVDETSLAGESPAGMVQRLSLAKARAVAMRLSGPAVVVGADTTVALDGQALGKPSDADDARRMLWLLRDRAHQVYTGVALVEMPGGRTWNWATESQVRMRPYGEAEVETYIGTGDPFDKAGAYAIQHPVFRPVARVEGCYANVMGLPLCDIVVHLREMDVPVKEDVHADCSAATGYPCALKLT